MDGRLRRHDEVADDHGDGDQHPAALQGGDALAQEVAHRHEAHVDAGQEQHQAQISIQEAHDHAHDLAAVQAAGQQLEDQEEPGNGGQGHQNFLKILRQSVGIGAEHLHGVLGVGHGHRGVAAAVGLV